MGRFQQENTENEWNLEAVFRTGKSPDFSGDVQLFSCAFPREAAGSHRKNPETFQHGILLPSFIHFRSSPAGYGDNSRIFPAGSSGIRLFPKSGIIDRGLFFVHQML
jgi:hypothetical protein